MSKTIKLIGIGEVPVVPASEIMIGDFVKFDHGVVVHVVGKKELPSDGEMLTYVFLFEWHHGGQFECAERADALMARVDVAT